MGTVRLAVQVTSSEANVSYTHRKLTAVLQSQFHAYTAVFSLRYNTLLFFFVLATEFVPPQGSSFSANITRKFTQKRETERNEVSVK